MKKNAWILITVLLAILLMNGCLTCEKKEYSFAFTGENSGVLTIRFVNIISTLDDSTDISEEDFTSLINDYLYGNSFESEFPEAQVTDKRLFLENGVLCGEIVFSFDDLGAAGLYRHQETGPFMYCLNCNTVNGEIFNSSNGEYGGDVMPVVFWEPTLKKLILDTYLTIPDETTISLADRYADWVKSH